MNTVRLVGAAALTLLVAACGEKQNPASANQEAEHGSVTARPSRSVYSGTGLVQSITGDRMAIAHGPIAGIGWPAMTMAFTVPPELAGAVKVGDKVDFSFRRTDSAYVLTSVKSR